MQVALQQIEQVYTDRIREFLRNGEALDANNLVEWSKRLFDEFSVSGISKEESSENDMLLFQYGVYNWGDAHGLHFSLDMTRQFLTPEDYEPYQLNLTLVYAPEPFHDVAAYNCWSDEYKDMESFVAQIKSTEGFIAASQQTPLTYKLVFSQC